jgi:hypothetical protein
MITAKYIIEINGNKTELTHDELEKLYTEIKKILGKDDGLCGKNINITYPQPISVSSNDILDYSHITCKDKQQ